MKSTAELIARITPEQQLLLRAVLLDGEPARTAFQEWREAVVIDDVDGVSQRLLPLLARRLGDVGPDDPVRSLIRGIYRHAWVRSHRLWRDALPVFVELRERGIPVILLKGAALLHSYGNDWGARPMFDIDALVRPADVPAAFGVLETLGWTTEYDMTFDWIRSRAMTRRHGWGFLREDGRLDMHWHVLSESLGSHSDDAFWDAAVPFETEGFTARTLAPADLLLHLLVHGTSGLNAPVAQWVADAVHVVRTYGADTIASASCVRRVRTASSRPSRPRSVRSASSSARTRWPRSRRASRSERAAPVERLRRSGTAGAQLAQRAAGGNGIARGAIELVTDRLDLGLSGLARALGRVRRVGPRARGRAARPPVHRLARAPGGRRGNARGDDAELDFTAARHPRSVRRHGLGPRRGRRQHDTRRRSPPRPAARAGARTRRSRLRDHAPLARPSRARSRCAPTRSASRSSTSPQRRRRTPSRSRRLDHGRDAARAHVPAQPAYRRRCPVAAPPTFELERVRLEPLDRRTRP